VRSRHLDYEPGTPVDRLGRAAIDDLLDRGDLADWTPLAAAIVGDPYGTLAETVRELCAAHPMYGTSLLWRSWIDRLRRASAAPPSPRRLAELRAVRGLTQVQVASRAGMAQSDVSKLERRGDPRLSTLERYVSATGGRLHLIAVYPDISYEIRP